MSRKGRAHDGNEDRFLIHRTRAGMLAAVADGVGNGHRGGYAATLAMRSLRRFDEALDPRRALVSRVLTADLDIRAARRDDGSLERMCTTLTAAYVVGARAEFVHAGDSRLYLVRGDLVAPLTRDHKVLQAYVDSGDMTEAQADAHPRRNMLRQCLGCPLLEPDVGTLDLASGDVLVLCTDGLHGAVSPEHMLRSLGCGADLRRGVASLLARAVAPGTRDDATLLAVRV